MQDHDEATGGSSTEADPEKPVSNPSMEPGSEQAGGHEAGEPEDENENENELDPERKTSNPSMEPGSD